MSQISNLLHVLKSYMEPGNISPCDAMTANWCGRAPMTSRNECDNCPMHASNVSKLIKELEYFEKDAQALSLIQGE